MTKTEQKAYEYSLQVAERFSSVPDERINRHDVTNAAYLAYQAGQLDSQEKIEKLEELIDSLKEEIQDLSHELSEAKEDNPSGWNKIEERERS